MGNAKNILTDTQITDFKRELKDLLVKYNAEIYAQMDGDTHGVSSEVVIDLGNIEVIRKNDSISQYDIK